MPENGQWLARSYDDIETQIELQAVKEVRVRDVPLYDIVCVQHFLGVVELEGFPELINVVYEENSTTLTALTRLDYEYRVFIFLLNLLDVCLKFLQLVRYDPSLWIETKVDGELYLHLLERLCEEILLRYTAHGREVVHPLEALQLAELFRGDTTIIPYQVNICMSVSLFLLLTLQGSCLCILLFNRLRNFL